jgi:hypothetical protein
MNQSERLLEALRKGPITPLDAWRYLGIYRLGARIFDLKRQGHPIVTELLKVGPRRVAQYRLEGRP